MPILAVVFAMAWWTSFKEKSFARVWGIIASLINVQIAILPVLVPPHSILNGFLLLLAVGVAGLVAFSWRVEESDGSREQHQSAAVAGDGTNNLLNKAGPLFALIVGGAAFSSWQKWVRVNDVPFDHSNTYLTLASVLIFLLIVTIHECGHAAVGLALGMKLRAFMVGPFQWSIRDGNWHFRFEPRQILTEGGATGLVPPAVNFPRWAHLCMLFGGVFANSVTGAIALWLALTRDPQAAVQASGFLALFAAWSLVLAAGNLIPVQTPIGYSDGAHIYQWLANTAWADLRRAFAISGATLVTPLRPRDYDIGVILRASHSIRKGPYALTLRLFAYWHFLDQGKISEAAASLTEAGQIYNESASNISAGLLPVFVFGAAYVWRNPEGSRAWWNCFQATKPTRFDTDYWLAASALHWAEGNSNDASQALSKAEQLAQALPDAGAYEFERYCCLLLRHALAELPTPA